jgi:apolipoprotein N-acyltransferase
MALLAGAASALAFPPLSLFPVLFLTMPVLVWLLDGATSSSQSGFFRGLAPTAAIGWTFGFGFFLGGLWWIGAAFLVDAGGFAFLMPLAVLALPALLALFWAVAAALARALWSDGAGRIPVFAVAFTLAEYARGHLLTGFPWNAVGYALAASPVAMQSASLFGIWGMTLVAFFVFAAPATLGDRHRRGTAVIITAAVVILAADLGFGLIRLAGATDGAVPGVQLRIVQPAIPQDERWQAASAEAIMQQYIALSTTPPDVPSTPPFTLLIWPESAFPFFLTDRPEALSAIAALLPEGTNLITGAARRDPLSAPGGPAFNSIYVINDGGEIEAAYDKVHLVPFGEYLPLEGVFATLGLRQLVAIPGGFAAGTIHRTMAAGAAPPFSPLICYEAIFPGTVVEPGTRPGWLLNVTNDGWYGNTPGPYQHFLQARVRAVEEGLPLVRAANSGISAIVDGYGRIQASLPVDDTRIIDGALPKALPATIYARYGDLILAVMLALTSVIALLGKVYLRFELQLTWLNTPDQYPPPSIRA